MEMQEIEAGNPRPDHTSWEGASIAIERIKTLSNCTYFR